MPTDVQKFSRGYKGKVGRTPASEAEHQGRVPQPGVPRGPRNSPKPEVTAATAPTVTVSPTGVVSTENYGPSPAERRAARQAVAKEQQAKRRVRRVRTYVAQREQEPKREVHVSKEFLDKVASPKPVLVSEHTRKLPGSEAPRAKPVKVASHQRALPTRQEKQAARKRVQVTKRQLEASSPTGNTVSGKVAQTLTKLGYDKNAASGIIGNAVQESSLDPTAMEPGTHNGGLWGFTAEPNSLSDLEAYAAEHGKSWANPKVQARFLNEHVSPETKAALNAARSPQEAAVIFQEGFEHPYAPTANTPRREQGAVEAAQTVFSKPNPKAVRNYKAAVKEAKELGLRVTPAGAVVGKPPKQVVTKYKAARSAMSELDKLNNEGKLPYVWGGHHGNDNSFDCSGAVSYVLEKLKVLPKGGALVSGDMGSVLAPGPGALTVFYNGEHTFMYDAVKHEFWGTSDSNVAGGAGFFPNEVGESEVQGGNSAGAYEVGHIPGLGKKQALQMGGSLGGLTTTGTGSSSTAAIPGMELAPSGTTATIVEGQGQKVNGKAKFSKKPIELTPLQKIRRNVQKLRSLGTEIAGPGEETKSEAANKPGSSTLHQQLADLERKYSIGAV